MKKHLLTIMILFCSISTINAQYWSGSTPGNIYYNQGNVGIGITSPASLLQINSAPSETVKTVLSLTNPLGTTALNNGVAITLGSYATAYFAKIAAVFEGQNPNYLQPALAFYTMRDTYLAGSEVERMRISSGGNVGIGTTSPSCKLDVNGLIAAKMAGDAGIVAYSTDNYAPYLLLKKGENAKWAIGSERDNLGGFGGSAASDLVFYNYVTSSNSMVIKSTNGNVGIGTTLPVYKLDVNGLMAVKMAGDAGFVANSTDNNAAYIRFTKGGNAKWAIGADRDVPSGGFGSGEASDLAFYNYVTGVNSMTIKSTNGNVGIGTQSPSSKLSVYSNSTDIASFYGSTASASNYFNIINGTATGAYWRGYFIGANIKMTAQFPEISNEGYRGAAIGFSLDPTQGYIGFFTNTSTTAGTALSERMRIDPSGNVGIGITNPGSYKLNVNGKIRANEVVVNTTGADFVF